MVVAAFRGTLSRSFTSSLNRESPNTVPDTPPPWSSSFVCAVYPDLGMPGNFIPTGKVLNFPGLETGYNELPGLDMPRRTAHGLEYAILNYSPIPARSLCIGNASERTTEPAPLRARPRSSPDSLAESDLAGPTEAVQWLGAKPWKTQSGELLGFCL